MYIRLIAFSKLQLPESNGWLSCLSLCNGLVTRAGSVPPLTQGPLELGTSSLPGKAAKENQWMDGETVGVLNSGYLEPF